MALFKGGGLNEGSLLRRTLLHVGTFALGSLAFIAIVSFVLVSVAKSVLPTHGAKGAGDTKKDADTEETAAPANTKPGAPKLPRPKRTRDAIVEEETPSSDAEK